MDHIGTFFYMYVSPLCEQACRCPWTVITFLEMMITKDLAKLKQDHELKVVFPFFCFVIDFLDYLDNIFIFSLSPVVSHLRNGVYSRLLILQRFGIT